MRRPSQHPLLTVGERVRLILDGPEYRVARVNACAAYLKALRSEPKVVVIGERSFVAREEGGLLPVSPRAAVYREATDDRE